MKHEDAKKLFLDFNEGRVDDAARLRIQEHLARCDECRLYYEKMTLFLEKPDPESIPRLEPDIFLPAKIRAAAQARRADKPTRKRLAWGRLSLAGVSLVLAVVTGIILGTGLTSASYSSDETEIIESYSDVFSSTGFTDGWQDVIVYDEEENNG
jgi:predicted anti-sigma-YlaC factor YlaD